MIEIKCVGLRITDDGELLLPSTMETTSRRIAFGPFVLFDFLLATT